MDDCGPDAGPGGIGPGLHTGCSPGPGEGHTGDAVPVPVNTDYTRDVVPVPIPVSTGRLHTGWMLSRPRCR